MQIGDRFVREAAQLLRPRGAVAQHRDEALGAREQFLEARRRSALMGLRLGHSILFGKGLAAYSLLTSPQLGDILSTCQSCPDIRAERFWMREEGDQGETWFGYRVAGFGERHLGERRAGGCGGRRSDRHLDLQCLWRLG